MQTNCVDRGHSKFPEPMFHIITNTIELCVSHRGDPHHILACEHLPRMPLSHPIVILSPVTNEPVYRWNVQNFPSLLLPWSRHVWNTLMESNSFFFQFYLEKCQRFMSKKGHQMTTFCFICDLHSIQTCLELWQNSVTLVPCRKGSAFILFLQPFSRFAFNLSIEDNTFKRVQ